MAQVHSWVLTHRRMAIAIVLATLVISILGFIAVARATDRSQFCASCHEMAAYYDSWEQGPHADVACVDCHVDDGNTARLLHKMEAAEEVWSHIAKEPTFPIAGNNPVTDERCLRCHENVNPGITGFNHENHRAGRPCADCHSDVGHRVTEQALRDAGTFDAAAWAELTAARVAVAGDGAANLQGHRRVSCDSCHDMAATSCGSCHEPNHDPTLPLPETVAAPGGATCQQCHTSAAAWDFSHPKDATCERCHSLPNDHTKTLPAVFTVAASSTATTPPTAPACVTCHASAGVDWAFAHPASGTDCETCHQRPAEHGTGPCTTCHATSTAWTFSHPDSTSCAECHSRPSGHRAGTCTTCHAPGSSWSFRHPSSGATCTNCHNRPSGHSSRSCTTCHATGSSWSFRHPSSTSCATCHKAPSNHYGSSCVSCHSPNTRFSNATFSHPRLKEHTYRSFACTKCHPSGYSSATCTACHGPGGPEGD